MSAEITFYGDDHGDETGAKNYQRAIEVQDPDAVFLEFDEQGENAEYLMEAFEEYSRPREVLEVFGYEAEDHDNPNLDTPLYAMSGQQMKKIKGALSEYIDAVTEHEENLGPDTEILGEEQDKALKSMSLMYITKFSDDSNTLPARLAHSLQHTDTDINFIDVERERLFEYGASEIDDLPDDPEKVEQFYEKARRQGQGTNNLQLQVASSMYPEKNIGEGLNQWLEEIDEEIRNPEMTRQISDGIEGNDYENVAVVTGRGHTAELAESLGEDHEVLMEDLTG